FFNSLANGKVGPFPKQFVWMIVVLVILGFFLERHKAGFWIKATGGNAKAAIVAGIRTNEVKIGTFMIAGLCAAMAGILDFSFIGSTDTSAGTSLTFPVFASV